MIYKRTINDQCYKNFPVKNLNSSKIFFLQIANKHLLSSIPLLKYIRRPFVTYLKDVRNTYYHAIAAGNNSVATIKTDNFTQSHCWQSKRIRGYEERLLTQSPD